ncbi:MAG: hypothetical protein ACRD1I_07815, partial [Terriglobia bacterium]
QGSGVSPPNPNDEPATQERNKNEYTSGGVSPPKRLKTKHGGGDAAATTAVVTQTLKPGAPKTSRWSDWGDFGLGSTMQVIENRTVIRQTESTGQDKIGEKEHSRNKKRIVLLFCKLLKLQEN